jgi:hypothetical protein
MAKAPHKGKLSLLELEGCYRIVKSYGEKLEKRYPGNELIIRTNTSLRYQDKRGKTLRGNNIIFRLHDKKLDVFLIHEFIMPYQLGELYQHSKIHLGYHLNKVFYYAGNISNPQERFPIQIVDTFVLKSRDLRIRFIGRSAFKYLDIPRRAPEVNQYNRKFINVLAQKVRCKK